MDDDQAKLDFQKASTLYEMGRHQESMQMLTNLDRAMPNNPDILYALARSMVKLGGKEDALEICERLESRFGHKKAGKLREKILSEKNAEHQTEDRAARIVEIEGVGNFD